MYNQKSANELFMLAMEQHKIEIDYAEQNKTSLHLAITEIDENTQQYNDLITKYEEQATLINLHESTIKTQQHLLLLAEKTEHEKIALQNKTTVQQVQIKNLQTEITALKGPDSPQKQRRLIKTQQAKAIERNKRIDTLTKEAKIYRSDINQVNEKLNISIDKIRLLTKELAHNTGSGLYHKGNHHLIIWPEKTKMQRPDGSVFEGRSLLYMHNSGCARLITFDTESSQVHMCKTPPGGLRLTEDVKEFAKNWLFQVNELQNGIVHDADMIAVNHNPDLKPIDEM